MSEVASTQLPAMRQYPLRDWAPFVRFSVGDTKFSECFDPHRRFLPLLPVDHADAAPQPLVRVGNELLHTRSAEVVHPPDQVSAEVPPKLVKALSAIAGGEFLQPSFTFRQRFLVGTVEDEGPSLLSRLPPETKAEKLQLGVRDVADLRLLDVDPQEERLFDEGADPIERALGGFPASAHDHEVVRVATNLWPRASSSTSSSWSRMFAKTGLTGRPEASRSPASRSLRFRIRGLGASCARA